MTPLVSLLALASSPAPIEATDFSRLSPEAQNLIVDAAMGLYDESPPPEILDSVRAEIAGWAQSSS